MALGKDEIVVGLQELGIQPGIVLMVHSSLSALGEVEGGANTVIEALLEVLGPEGTLLMPAMSGDVVFDLDESRVNVGLIPETFRHWPGVIRSLHPTHSVCALGPQAQYLIEGHIDEPTAIGPGSPWGKLANMPNGYVLLMGVDQDRNTLLHYPEDIVDAPYLSTIEREYKDPSGGEIRLKQLCRFPGPHRDFIGLDRLFLEGEAMRVGQVGTAVCRLMHAGQTVELELSALRADPAAVLCTNPRCVDCLRQRAAIRRVRLAAESFTLTAVVDDVGAEPAELRSSLETLRLVGVQDVELGPDLTAALVVGGEEAQLAAAEALSDTKMRLHTVAWRLPSEEWVPGNEPSLRDVLILTERLGGHKLILTPGPLQGDPSPGLFEEAAKFIEELRPAARAAGLGLMIENVPGSLLARGENCAALLGRLGPDVAELAFNPAHFAQAGERPFLQTFYKCSFKPCIGQLYVCDGCGPGAPLYRPYTLPGEGQGEVKELISILRCRSFGGSLCLRLGWGRGEQDMRDQANAFWRLMDTL